MERDQVIEKLASIILDKIETKLLGNREVGLIQSNST
jgi:hypothetical protein